MSAVCIAYFCGVKYATTCDRPVAIFRRMICLLVRKDCPFVSSLDIKHKILWVTLLVETYCKSTYISLCGRKRLAISVVKIGAVDMKFKLYEVSVTPVWVYQIQEFC